MGKVETIKSALKFLVQKQIEQGSHGFSDADDNEISWDEIIGWLEQQPKTIQEKQAESEKYQKAFDDGYENGYAQARFDYEQQPCEDCISREDAIKQCGFGMTNLLIADCLRRLPSVTSQKSKGKWIHNNCSICGYGVRPWNNTPYCPNCGADMRESEDEG